VAGSVKEIISVAVLFKTRAPPVIPPFISAPHVNIFCISVSSSTSTCGMFCFVYFQVGLKNSIAVFINFVTYS